VPGALTGFELALEDDGGIGDRERSWKSFYRFDVTNDSINYIGAGHINENS
jgi:hypothetical protein